MANLFAPAKPKSGDKKEDPLAKESSKSQKAFNDMSARLKMTEERFSELGKKLQFVEQSALSHQKKLARELKTINSDITDLKHQTSELKNKIVLIIKELQLSASLEDVDVLKKYLELWQPVKFVTESMVEKIVDEKLDELKQKMNID